MSPENIAENDPGKAEGRQEGQGMPPPPPPPPAQQVGVAGEPVSTQPLPTAPQPAFAPPSSAAQSSPVAFEPPVAPQHGAGATLGQQTEPVAFQPPIAAPQQGVGATSGQQTEPVAFQPPAASQHQFGVSSAQQTGGFPQGSPAHGVPGGHPQQFPSQTAAQASPQAPYSGVPYPQGAPAMHQPPTQAVVRVVETIDVVPIDHVSITTGFNYAWMKFRQNMGVLILVALTYMAIAAGLTLLISAMLGGSARARSGVLTALVFLIMIAVIILFPAVAQANLIRGISAILSGKPVQYGSFFQFKHVGNVLIAWVIIALISALLGFTMVGPIVVALVTMFTYWLVIDKDYGPWLAITTSMKIVWNNIATVVVFLIASAIATSVGTLFFGVGILFAAPVVLIAQGWLYKTLIGEEVAQ